MGSANAATFYVSVSGNDANPGSQAAPFRHVSKGVAAAISPGDTVIVMNGTYDNEGVKAPDFVVTLYSSGAPGNPITIMAQNRGQAILDGGNTSNANCTGASAYFNLFNASFVNVQGFVIQNTCEQAIQSNNGAHDITIRWNELRNIGNWFDTSEYGLDGIYLNSSEYNFTFDGNIFHDIGRVGGVSNLHFDHGIYTHASNVFIVNNVFYNMSKGWSIQLADGAANYTIANNTFAFPNASGSDGQIMFWGGNTNIKVTNNIFYQPAGAAMSQFAANVTAEFDHNLVFGSGTIMSYGGGVAVGEGDLMGANPNFVNPGAFNFALNPGSPAIGAGVAVSGVLTDLGGNPRSATPNIGAN
jgi:hypothetical protein